MAVARPNLTRSAARPRLDGREHGVIMAGAGDPYGSKHRRHLMVATAAVAGSTFRKTKFPKLAEYSCFARRHKRALPPDSKRLAPAALSYCAWGCFRSFDVPHPRPADRTAPPPFEQRVPYRAVVEGDDALRRACLFVPSLAGYKPGRIGPGTRLGDTVVRRSTCALASSTLSPARAARGSLIRSERLAPLPGGPSEPTLVFP